MAGFLYEFEWDPFKARVNYNKHGVDFERATDVFRDPLALTILDEEHGGSEARWISLGKESEGKRCACPFILTRMCRVIWLNRPPAKEYRSTK